MNQKDYIMDALEIVSAWDIPEEELADAINEQAKLMAGDDHDDFLGSLIDIIN